MQAYEDLVSPNKLRSANTRDWEKVTTKAFIAWINAILASSSSSSSSPSAWAQEVSRVADLSTDLRDGTVLIAVLNHLHPKANLEPVVADRKRGNSVLSPSKRAGDAEDNESDRSKLVRLQNLEIVWAQFRADNVSMVNISAEDIEGGNTKITLALIWHLIMHYFIVDASASSGVVKRGVDGEYHLNAKQELLAFCNEQLKEYKHIKSPITNFTSDWTSGHVLHALVDSCTDATRALPADEAEPVDVARAATAKALADLRIPIMVEPEDLCVRTPEPRSVMAYVAFFQAHVRGKLDKRAETEQADSTALHQIVTSEQNATSGWKRASGIDWMAFSIDSTVDRASFPFHRARVLIQTDPTLITFPWGEPALRTYRNANDALWKTRACVDAQGCGGWTRMFHGLPAFAATQMIKSTLPYTLPYPAALVRPDTIAQQLYYSAAGSVLSHPFFYAENAMAGVRTLDPTCVIEATPDLAGSPHASMVAAWKHAGVAGVAVGLPLSVLSGIVHTVVSRTLTAYARRHLGAEDPFVNNNDAAATANANPSSSFPPSSSSTTADASASASAASVSADEKASSSSVHALSRAHQRAKRGTKSKQSLPTWANVAWFVGIETLAVLISYPLETLARTSIMRHVVGEKVTKKSKITGEDMWKGAFLRIGLTVGVRACKMLASRYVGTVRRHTRPEPEPQEGKGVDSDSEEEAKAAKTRRSRAARDKVTSILGLAGLAVGYAALLHYASSPDARLLEQRGFREWFGSKNGGGERRKALRVDSKYHKAASKLAKKGNSSEFVAIWTRPGK